VAKAHIGFSIIASAAKARSALSENAIEAVKDFVLSKQSQQGGFCGRTDEPDTYYTFFGLGCAGALGLDVSEETRECVRGLEAGTFDAVHAVCLVRSQCLMQRYGLIRRLAGSRFATLIKPLSGGLHQRMRSGKVGAAEAFKLKYGNTAYIENCADLYLAFLVFQAMEDVGLRLPNETTIQDLLNTCQAPNGGFGSKPGMQTGVATATAAALVLQRRMGLEVDTKAAQWLASLQQPEGGYLAVPGAPIPDLLTSAAVLFGLDYAGIGIQSKSLHKDFVAAHWNEDGGFCGSMADLTSDVEYTFYGLLALGLLA